MGAHGSALRSVDLERYGGNDRVGSSSSWRAEETNVVCFPVQRWRRHRNSPWSVMSPIQLPSGKNAL